MVTINPDNAKLSKEAREIKRNSDYYDNEMRRLAEDAQKFREDMEEESKNDK